MRRAAVALSLATLFFGRQIASWSDAENRYLHHRGRPRAAGAPPGLRPGAGPRRRKAVRGRGPGGVRAGGAHPLLVPAGGAAGGEGRGHRRAPRRATRADPLSPDHLLEVLAGASHPIFILLFDEWSLARSERGGEFPLELANLRRLAARSTVYREARAPGDATQKSIPRLLYGDNGEVVPRNGRAMWQAGDSLADATARPNLFRVVRERGYRAEAAGWYLPSAALVRDDLDGCRTWPQVPKRDGAGRVWDLLWANLRHLPDPLSRALWRQLYARAFSANWYGLERRIEAEVMRVAREGPDHTLAFLHFPLPHAPFVFDADGRYAGPFEGGRMFGTPEEYARQIRYLDVVVGRFLDTLEAAGRLDSALVIVTSDHSWKKDPDKRERVRERLRRVPLVIKAPGQREGAVVEEELCLHRLRGLIAGTAGAVPGSAGPLAACDVP